MDPHTFSIGFRSGLSAGVFHQLTFYLVKFCMQRLLCFGSLSCWNLWWWGNLALKTGSRPAFKMVAIRVAAKFSVNMIHLWCSFHAYCTPNMHFQGVIGLWLKLSGLSFSSWSASAPFDSNSTLIRPYDVFKFLTIYFVANTIAAFFSLLFSCIIWQ